MATVYDYRYYIDGTKIAILQRQWDSIYDPFLSVTDDLYETPTNSDSSAIYIRYTISRSVPDNTTDVLPVSKTLSRAIVHYVKAMLAEEKDDLRMNRYHMNRFQYFVSRHQNNLKTPGRVILPGHIGSIIRIN